MLLRVLSPLPAGFAQRVEGFTRHAQLQERPQLSGDSGLHLLVPPRCWGQSSSVTRGCISWCLRGVGARAVQWFGAASPGASEVSGSSRFTWMCKAAEDGDFHVQQDECTKVS